MNPDVGFDAALCFSGVCSPSATLSKLRIHQPQWCENEFQGRVWFSHRVHERRDFHPTSLAHLISSLLRPPTQVVHEPRTCRTFRAHAFNARCDAAPSFPEAAAPPPSFLSSFSQACHRLALAARRCGTDPLLTSVGPA